MSRKQTKRQKLLALSEKYNIPFNTLKSKSIEEAERVVISTLTKEWNISLEEFLTLRDDTNPIAKKIAILEESDLNYHTLLSLAILEHENETSFFIDDALFENRDRINELRKKIQEG